MSQEWPVSQSNWAPYPPSGGRYGALPDILLTQVAINNYHPAFREIADLFAHTAAGLGVRVMVRTLAVHEAVDVTAPGYLNVLVGHVAVAAALLRDAMAGAPFVLWQLEPLADASGLAAEEAAYRELIHRAAWVWDYNPGNIRMLHRWGVSNTALLPFGYHPILRTVPEDLEKACHLCFFGSLTPRRQRILEELRAAGFAVAYGVCFGEQRNELIARSLIALNLHAGDDLAILEEARISFLLANRCFVVSETSDHNPYGGGVIYADPGDLAAVCAAWVRKSDEERLAVAERGHAALLARPFAASLHQALALAAGAVRLP